MRIIVFADVHYFMGDLSAARFNTKGKLVQFALELLEKLTDLINNSDVDMCVNLGDLIQDLQNRKFDFEALAFMFDKLKQIKKPCYSVLGNHDMKMADTASEIEEIMGYKSTYSFDADGFHLVFLTTEVRPELGLENGGCYKAQYLSDEDLEWVKNDLEKNTLPCVIFTHYGIAEDETIPHERMFMKNRFELKEIFKSHDNILGVISGHQHRMRKHLEDGIDYYVLGSLTGCTRGMEGVPDGVYFDIELKDGKMIVEEKHLEL